MLIMLQFVLSKAVEEEEFRVQFFNLEILLSKFELLCMELPCITPWDGRDLAACRFIPLQFALDSAEAPIMPDFLIRLEILFWFILSIKLGLFWELLCEESKFFRILLLDFTFSRENFFEDLQQSTIWAYSVCSEVFSIDDFFQ